MGACLGSSKKKKDSDDSPTFRHEQMAVVEEKPYQVQVNAEIQSRQTAPLEQNQYKIGKPPLLTLLHNYDMSTTLFYVSTVIFPIC